METLPLAARVSIHTSVSFVNDRCTNNNSLPPGVRFLIYILQISLQQQISEFLNKIQMFQEIPRRLGTLGIFMSC